MPIPTDLVVVDPLRLGKHNMDCEAFTTLLPDGERGLRNWEKEGRDPATVHDYLMKRIMSTRQQFQIPDYLFWALHVHEQDALSRQVGVHMMMNKKTHMTWDNVVDGLLAKDKALFSKMAPIMKRIRGTTAFWHQERQNVFAMLRELGVPTWFFTITANEAGWPDLVCELLAMEVRATDFLLNDPGLAKVVQVLYNEVRDKPELLLRWHMLLCAESSGCWTS